MDPLKDSKIIKANSHYRTDSRLYFTLPEWLYHTRPKHRAQVQVWAMVFKGVPCDLLAQLAIRRKGRIPTVRCFVAGLPTKLVVDETQIPLVLYGIGLLDWYVDYLTDLDRIPVVD